MALDHSWDSDAADRPSPWATDLAGPFPRGAGHLRRLSRRLSALREERLDDPVANPVERLGYEISRDIDTGRLSLEDLGELVRALVLSGYLARADRLADHVGGASPGDGEARIRAAVRAVLAEAGEAPSLDAFRARVETPALGVVFTAHPTFAVPEALMEGIACLAASADAQGRPLSESARAGIVARAARENHTHARAPTLRDEQARAGRAIERCRTALDRAHAIVLEEARAAWPDGWTRVVPRLATAASWTGYDLDGRIDVTWADILRARVDSAIRMARHYADRLAALGSATAAPEGTEIADLARCAREAAETLSGLSDLLAGAHGDTDAARAVGRRLAATDGPPLDTATIERSLAGLLPALDPEAQIEAQLIRAELHNFGLGEAHVHFRVNAVQLYNALREETGEDGLVSGAGSRRRTARLDAMFEAVEAKTVNIGSVVVEPTTARRMMMLASLIRRHIDPRQPIRFLIAECDTAFGVLSALYLARLFAVDDILDISPLFETRASLQRGHEMIADLLTNPHYRAYIARRGRLAVQTGYSDGGRAVGQATVSLAIERLRIKVAQALADSGLGGIELVVFDTHGESIGRGAHPGGMQARLDYVDTPHSRKVLAGLGITHVQEVSFQGGDGYVFFANPNLALASLSTLIAHRLTPPPADEDPFYAQADHALEVFLDMRAFNESLTGDPNYVHWLSTFATSVLPPSGSRAVSRPDGERKSVFDMRAIPHNAALQQMGMLVNSLAGVGAALAPDIERAAELYRASPRFRSLLDLTARARALSSVDAMGAYIDLLNPVKWLRRAAVEDEAGRRGERMRTVARLLARHGRYREANAFMHRVLDDLLDFDRVLAGCGILPGLGAREIELDVMHAVRLTLARRILLLAADVPTFTVRPGFEPERIERDLVTLDVPRAVAKLREVFPESPAVVVDDSFGAPATYRSDAQRGYHPLHETVFRPLETHHDLLRRVGSAITHQIGAFG